MSSRNGAPLALLLAAVAVVGLAGCTPGSAPESAPEIAGLAACVGLSSLPTAECGTIEVDLDRSNPDAGTTTVSFALVPRTDQSKPSQGTVVPNPGGPGTSNIDYAGALYAAGLAPLLERRDLLLIDPRGTGRSDPLECASLDGPDLAFSSIEEQRRAIGECGVELGDKAGYFGTAAVADDFDAVRAALGVDKLDLLGDSYGTFLMATYANRHPEHVRSIVLSGAYAVNEDASGTVAAKALVKAVTLVGERTGAYDGATALADLAAVATSLRTSPEALEVEFDGTTRRVVLDEAILAGAVGKLYSSSPDTEAQVGLASAASAGAAGDLAPIRALVTQHLSAMAGNFSAGPAEYAGAASWATACHDYPRPFDYEDDLSARSADLAGAIVAQEGQEFGPFSAEAWLTRDSYDFGACLYWPNDPTAGTPYETGAAMPDVPVLVLSGELDANTTSESGRASAAQFPNAEWVEVENAGHTPTATAEGQELLMRFIAEGGK